LHESTYGDISRAVDEAFIFSRVNHELDILTHETNLKFDQALHVPIEAHAAVTGGAQEKFHYVFITS